ncbi:hypothetical protein, partial [uncultured Duncaniella sp.]
MKLRNLLYFAAGSLLLSTVSCSHEEVEPYSGPKAGIFIQEVAGTNMTSGLVSSYRDSTNISFASAPAAITDYVLRFTIRTIGDVTDYPRKYSIKVDE